MRLRHPFLTAFFVAFGLALWGCGDHEDHEHDKGKDPSKNDESQPGHSHAKAEAHGGTVTMAEGYHFETAFHKDGVAVYVYGPKQEPLDPKDASGSVTVEFQDGKAPVQAKLAYVPAGSGKDVGLLLGGAALEDVEEASAKAVVDLVGLPGEPKEFSYKTAFHFAPDALYECPMKCVPPQKDPGKCSKCGMALVKKPIPRPAVPEEHGHEGHEHDHEHEHDH